MHTVVKNIPGPKTYLLKDKEAYIAATSEMDGAHGLTRDTMSLANELQQVLHGAGKRRIGKESKHNSAKMYAHRFIKEINKEDEKSEGQKRKTKTSMIRVSGLIHKRENQSDPRLAWLMFQKIYLVYHDINNKEQSNSPMILTSMS